MDGVISPVPTTDPSSGAVEALTVTPAFFEYQGWLGAGAYGRRGGATLAQEFVTVAATKPTYLVFNQVCPVVVRETNPPLSMRCGQPSHPLLPPASNHISYSAPYSSCAPLPFGRQWNEFDGQPNGATTYVDCYSPRYSNDIEPTALRLCGNALRQGVCVCVCVCVCVLVCLFVCVCVCGRTGLHAVVLVRSR